MITILFLLTLRAYGVEESRNNRIIFFITRNETVYKTAPNSTYNGEDLKPDMVCAKKFGVKN